jgi:hypothetical protein
MDGFERDRWISSQAGQLSEFDLRFKQQQSRGKRLMDGAGDI